MPAYRFVAFPTGAVPSAAELAEFSGFAELLQHRIAYGKHWPSGGLAIACDAEVFDRLRRLDPAFEDLLTKWQVRGAEISERLAFSKDTKPWKKLKQAQINLSKPSEKRRLPERPIRSSQTPDEFQAVALERSARESEGWGRIEIAKQIGRGASYQRLAARLPYIPWVAGAVVVMATGIYLGHRLQAPRRERRSETIERLAEDAMDGVLQATTDPKHETE